MWRSSAAAGRASPRRSSSSRPTWRRSRSSSAATQRAACGARTRSRGSPATCPRSSTPSRSSRSPGRGRTRGGRRSCGTPRRSSSTSAFARASASAPPSPVRNGARTPRAYRLSTDDGDAGRFEVVISAIGLFNGPRYPDWPGLADFAGTSFHTARWEHGHDLAGKRVAVVGTGATAAQVVPTLAPAVEKLYVFQREPGWAVPRGDRDWTPAERRALARPLRRRMARMAAYWRVERMLFLGNDEDARAAVEAAAHGGGLHRLDPRRPARPPARRHPELPDPRQAPRVRQRLLRRPPTRQCRTRAPRGHARHAGRRRRRQGCRARDRRARAGDRVHGRGLPLHPVGAWTRRPRSPRLLGRRAMCVPGYRRSRLPQLLHPLRAEHERRGLAGGADRAPGGVHRPRREAARSGRRHVAGALRPRLRGVGSVCDLAQRAAGLRRGAQLLPRPLGESRHAVAREHDRVLVSHALPGTGDAAGGVPTRRRGAACRRAGADERAEEVRS